MFCKECGDNVFDTFMGLCEDCHNALEDDYNQEIKELKDTEPPEEYEDEWD